ncbi:MAG: hypothetical protein ACT4PN_13210 [Nitrospiraceae bacterium]
MSKVLHVNSAHPLNKLDTGLRARFIQAQTELVDMEFRTSADLLRRVFEELKLKISPPPAAASQPVTAIADLAYKALVPYFADMLRANGIPAQANRRHAASLAHRVQLLRAFADPDHIVVETVAKISTIVAGFPRNAEHIQRGRNPGDVLDPYILAASQQLVYGGDLESTFTATVAHKILMIVEGLMGHLHEDVVGAMRGNLRAPEPRGDDQETLDPRKNPFPGADIVQPPLGKRRPLRFHQVKSKTGSAKGGDGRRLGLQLLELQRLYGGEIYYDALIGNTLRGHRSMAGVLRAAPNAVVLVGESAFLALTGTANGPELLLRLYQAAFDVAAQQSGYKIQDVVEAVYATFRQRATEAGESFLDAILHDAISGLPDEQDSRMFRNGR